MLLGFFFFQTEDGIRDSHVTGVQTCALPIWLLGVDPGRSIAFEDSVSGATSAHRAGVPVWFLTGHTADPQVPVDRALGSLTEVGVQDVLDGLARERQGMPGG